MTDKFVYALVIFLASASMSSSRAAPPEASEPKKLQFKPPLPPFPDEPLDNFPQPIKPVQATEIAPTPRPDDTSPPAYEVIKVVPGNGLVSNTGTVAIGFFNHSERDVVLQINDRTVRLGSHYYLQMKLPREFSWREKEGPPQSTKVPAEAEGVEIVFRK